MGSIISFIPRGLLIYFATALAVFGQTTNSPSVQQVTSSVAQQNYAYQVKADAIWQQRQALLQEEANLEANGATQDQLAAWYQQNAAQFTALEQQAKNLAASRQLPVLAPLPPPSNATAEMKQYLQNQAALANSFAQLHNESLAVVNAAAGQDPSTTPSSDDSVAQQYQQQNATLLQQQQQLAITNANQEAQNLILAPPPLVLPANASPQLQAFLTARDQLMRDEIQFLNQYRTSTPAVRAAAFLQWRQSNAALYLQLKQLAQAVQNQ